MPLLWEEEEAFLKCGRGKGKMFPKGKGKDRFPKGKGKKGVGKGKGKGEMDVPKGKTGKGLAK